MQSLVDIFAMQHIFILLLHRSTFAMNATTDRIKADVLYVERKAWQMHTTAKSARCKRKIATVALRLLTLDKAKPMHITIKRKYDI
jgi:hypothetical protein